VAVAVVIQTLLAMDKAVAHLVALVVAAQFLLVQLMVLVALATLQAHRQAKVITGLKVGTTGLTNEVGVEVVHLLLELLAAHLPEVKVEMELPHQSQVHL
jgi:hypothetical protein